jgi:hypothetical protein
MISIYNHQNNISVYHFLSLYFHKNIDDYYLEDYSGKILSYNDIVKKGKKYIIKKKCRGGNTLDQSGNSFIITIFSAIIYAVITILYYNYYITNILLAKTSNIVKVNKVENLIKNSNKTEKIGKFKYLLKESYKKIMLLISDDCYDTFISDSFPYKKEMLIKNNQSSIFSIISFAIFATFTFMIIAPVFLNIATRISCGQPKITSIIFALIFIFIPFVICKFIPKIISLIEYIANKFGKEINIGIGNYKIAISNTILLFLLILYMIIGKKGLSKMMYGMFPIALIVFIAVKFIPTIPDIIHILSKFFSNFITNISPPVSDDKPEESRRYTFFYTLFEIVLFSIIGWILYTIAYIGQVKEYCPT